MKNRIKKKDAPLALDILLDSLTRILDDKKKDVCPTCEGAGKCVDYSIGSPDSDEIQTCKRCKGTGKYHND